MKMQKAIGAAFMAICALGGMVLGYMVMEAEGERTLRDQRLRLIEEDVEQLRQYLRPVPENFIDLPEKPSSEEADGEPVD